MLLSMTHGYNLNKMIDSLKIDHVNVSSNEIEDRTSTFCAPCMRRLFHYSTEGIQTYRCPAIIGIK